jgi:rhodanese-related sulfurtransferase
MLVILIGIIAGAIPALAADTIYRDPRQPSFTLLVPDGWTAERDDQGVIAGAVHVPRGMLEFYADPSSPAHHSDLLPERRVILHCARGGRSARAAVTLAAMGYRDVAHLDGGLTAWRQAGLPVGGS